MKRVILVGKAGTGKDYLRDHFHHAGYKVDVSMTTRPMRDEETAGYTYHYISDHEFESMIKKGEFYEYVIFNQWKYGTTHQSWKESRVFIMTPLAVTHILKEDREKCWIVYLDIDQEIRKKRISQRSDTDKVDRRLKADEQDFVDFSDYNMRITDPWFDAEKIITAIENDCYI